MSAQSAKWVYPHTPSIEPLEPRLMLSGNDPNPPIAVATPDFMFGAMLADPQRNVVYVVDQSDKRIVALDTDQGRIVRFANLASTAYDLQNAPCCLAISVDDSELFVSQYGANVIQVFSLPGLDFLRQLNVDGPAVIAAGAGGDVYVWRPSSNRGLQLDGQTGTVLNTLDYGDGLLRVNSNGTRLYISEAGSSYADEYDISDPSAKPKFVIRYEPYLLDRTFVSYGGDLAVDDQYGRFYSICSDGGVYVQDLGVRTYSVWQGLQWASSVAFTPTSPYVWAGGTASDSINRYDRATGELDSVIDADKDSSSNAVYQLQVTPNGNVVCRLGGNYGRSSKLAVIGIDSLSVALAPDDSLLVTDDSYTTTDKSVYLDTAAVGGTSDSKSFVLSLQGRQSVVISHWNVPDGLIATITDSYGKVVTPAEGSFVMAPGDCYAVDVTLDTTAPGDKSGNITFQTDDPEMPSVALQVYGQVQTNPSLDISELVNSGNTIVLPSTISEHTRQFCGTLFNKGQIRLLVTGMTIVGPDAQDFSVSLPYYGGYYPYTIDYFYVDTGAGLIISMCSDAVGPKDATLVFTTNDPNNPTVEIPLHSEVVLGPNLQLSVTQLSPQYGAYLKGEEVTVQVEISNIGLAVAQADSNKPILVEFDLVDGSGESLTAYGDEAAIQETVWVPSAIAPGDIVRQIIAFKVPDVSCAGESSSKLIATLTLQIDDEDEDNNETSIPFRAVNGFGTLHGRHIDVPMSFTDHDGTVVTMRLTGGGIAEYDQCGNGIKVYQPVEEVLLTRMVI